MAIQYFVNLYSREQEERPSAFFVGASNLLRGLCVRAVFLRKKQVWQATEIKNREKWEDKEQARSVYDIDHPWCLDDGVKRDVKRYTAVIPS